MCFKSKKSTSSQVLPAQAVSAQSVSSGSSVKTAVKQEDKDRRGEADLRSDVTADTGGSDENTTANIPTPGGVALGAKKKRKKVVGLDL